MASFDEELRKAFQELQAKVITTTAQVKVAEAQIIQLKRSIQHAQLTEYEVTQLPEETKAYESVGRMFILRSTKEVKRNLENRVKHAEDKIKGIEANKEYLQKSVKEQENSIREMLQQRV
ncbi:prefoldin subunit 1-like [Rhopilema esculentum]|uniref:prefoldin subunit 1-like n=1 Tax=Rhopilema esculentum TaxID=499914 RepID=UPI0031E21769|eukprot:gene12720-3441_t